MPTNLKSAPRLSLTLNEKDIEDLNDIREEWTRIDKAATYSYIDIVRALIQKYKSV